MEIETNYANVCPIVHIKGAFSKELCETITEEIIEYKKSGIENAPATNDLCWRGAVRGAQNYGYGITENSLEELQSVLVEAVNEFNRFLISHKTYIFKSFPDETIDTENPIMEAWFNVNQKGGENILHTHAGKHLSGVVYFQGTGTGPICFHSLETQYNIIPFNYPFNGTLRYEPDDGDILLFPSYLAHWVEPNPSDRERINMAFNIDYKMV